MGSISLLVVLAAVETVCSKIFLVCYSVEEEKCFWFLLFFYVVGKSFKVTSKIVEKKPGKFFNDILTWKLCWSSKFSRWNSCQINWMWQIDEKLRSKCRKITKKKKKKSLRWEKKNEQKSINVSQKKKASLSRNAKKIVCMCGWVCVLLVHSIYIKQRKIYRL